MNLNNCLHRTGWLLASADAVFVIPQV